MTNYLKTNEAMLVFGDETYSNLTQANLCYSDHFIVWKIKFEESIEDNVPPRPSSSPKTDYSEKSLSSLRSKFMPDEQTDYF